MNKGMTVQEAGRMGGLKGGPARAKKMSAKARSESAREAAFARSESLTPARRSEIARMGALARHGLKQGGKRGAKKKGVGAAGSAGRRGRGKAAR